MGFFGKMGFLLALILGTFAVGKASNWVMGVSPEEWQNPYAAAPTASRLAPVVNVENGNAAVAAAHAKAIASIGEFWTAYDRKAPNEGKYSLKVRIPVIGEANLQAEHVWLLDIKRERNGKYTGRLDNVPRNLPRYKIGDRVVFGDDMISDWMFVRDGKIVGNETARPLIARLPKEDADKARALFANP